MATFVEIDHIDKVFPLPNGDRYVALKNIDLTLQQGEFVSLVGHSGCGKSTLLNIVAGLDRATAGGVVLEGKQVTKPGPDRMVVFQNYSLLPWKTVYQNIALAVNSALKHRPNGERKAIIEHHLDLVGLRPARDKFPSQLSGGMKQRVAIARALALRPKLLLLDEPFGALDALTRGNLQQQLMKICQENQVTCLMVTHDVDEALLLSDRVVMLTNGPESRIGQILEVNIPRPRHRLEVVAHPSYYALRNEIVYFLDQQKRAKRHKATPAVAIARHGLEKVNLEIGFVPLTDCAPLIVAKEKGFFAKHGLEAVNLCREPSWKAIAEGVATGRLDAAQMVAGMPLALTLGMGTPAAAPTCTAMTLSRNGNAITLSKELYNQGIRTVDDLRQAIQQRPDQVHNLGITHPASMHNLLLRVWLASGGIDPSTEVSLVMTPPAQMVVNLKAGSIDGYCVGEPWNSRAVHEGIGVVAATDLDIWDGHPEKVLGVSETFAKECPQTHTALVKALMEACEYCDDRRNREEIVEMLCQPHYVGSTPEYTRPGFIDPFDRGDGSEPAALLNFNQFYVHKGNCPDRSEMLWMLTQFARWGMTPFPRNWIEVIDRVVRLDVFNQAAQELGQNHQPPISLNLERDRHLIQLLNEPPLNPDHPLEYLEQVAIKQPIQISEVNLDRSAQSAQSAQPASNNIASVA